MTLGVRFKTTRFHVLYGPVPLFERVEYKFQSPRVLKLHGKHFSMRQIERNIPAHIIQSLLKFSTNEWDLVTVEVRNDTGKFVNSTWEKVIEDKKYWVTIGFDDVVQTIIIKESDGLGQEIVKQGLFFEFVSEVNKQLMIQEFPE